MNDQAFMEVCLDQEDVSGTVAEDRNHGRLINTKMIIIPQ